MTQNIVGAHKAHYTILKKEKLGKGSYATVYKGFENKTKTPVAIKVIGEVRFKKNASKFAEVAQRELSIFKHVVNLPNVINMIDYAEGETTTHIIMEFCEGGTLRKLLRSQNEKRFEEAEAVRILKEIARGVFELHQKNIMHKDLNLENVLIKDDHFIIADLGSAVRKKKSYNFAGAEGYSAPEVYLAHKGVGYTKQVDIWAMGVMFFEMLYSRNVHKEMKQEIVEEERRGKDRFPKEPKVSKEAKDLLDKMLTVNPKKRITIEGIVNHPLMRKNGMPSMVYKEEEIEDESEEEEDSRDEVEITGEMIALRKLEQSDDKKIKKRLKKKLRKQKQSGMNEENVEHQEEEEEEEEEKERNEKEDEPEEEEEIEEKEVRKIKPVKTASSSQKKQSKKSKKKNKNKKSKANAFPSDEEGNLDKKQGNSNLLGKKGLSVVAVISALAILVGGFIYQMQ